MLLMIMYNPAAVMRELFFTAKEKTLLFN